MSTVFNVRQLLRAAPAREEIADQTVVKQQYRYWRWRIFYAMYIGYAFYYFTRKSFAYAMPALMADLGFTKTELGLIGSILSISYGISKVVSGVLGDKCNPRYFMSIGLVLTGIFNICFGFSSTILFFALFWGLNGWFQGWGWPPCARLLTHWYSKSERGTWWSIWSTCHNLGGAIIPILAAGCAQYYGWRSAMFVPGVLCILVGLFLFNRLRDIPQTLGLPSVEKFKNDLAFHQSADMSDAERQLSIKEILFKYVLTNKYIWILAVISFFVYVVRFAVNDWTILYLMETKGYTLVGAGTTVFWFEVGGFIGMLVAGWISDKLFQGRRGPAFLIFGIGVVAAVLAFALLPSGGIIIDTAILFTIGFFLFGPQMLIGLAAAELSHKNAAATASGFASGWFAYAGAAAAGFPIGLVTQVWGWDAFFVVLVVSSFVIVACSLPLYNAKPKTIT